MKKVLIPGTMGQLAKETCSILREREYDPVYLGEITAEDIDCGLAHIDNDICIPTIAIVGQYVRYFSEHGAEEGICVLAPEICRDCRSVSMPSVLGPTFKRAGLTGIEIVDFTSEQTLSAAPSEPPSATDDERPAIGLCGNMPVLTTHELHHVVFEHLEKSGCRVVMPPLQRIANERDFLTPALEYFTQVGVKCAICLLPFGCLGGHVYARGQLRKLQAEFPDVELTILDYDPSASDINLINRTELVIQSAKEHA